MIPTIEDILAQLSNEQISLDALFKAKAERKSVMGEMAELDIEQGLELERRSGKC